MDSPIIEKIGRDIVSIDLSSDDDKEKEKNDRINNNNIWFNFDYCYRHLHDCCFIDCSNLMLY
jgi:hypothetical protein